MEKFEYNGNPSRVIFGRGTISQLGRELTRLSVSSPLLLSTPEQIQDAQLLEGYLGQDICAAGIFSEATMHTPLDVTERALKFLTETGADGIVSIGGGSTIGLGKAIAVRTNLPHLCIPTTYSGSEMTPILGETVDQKKTTRRDPLILPKTVIYDVNLTDTLPRNMSATSGVNAISHAIEALYASNTNPIIRTLALKAIHSLATSLPIINNATNNQDLAQARYDAFVGAWLCGVCLGSVDMALHHKLCHTLGGSFNLPHAQTHTIILPHTLAYNAPAIKEILIDLADALPDSNRDAIHGLNVLLDKLGVKRALKDYGMKEEDIAKAAEIAVANPYANPRQVEKSSIQELIRRAWAGDDAKADF